MVSIYRKCNQLCPTHYCDTYFVNYANRIANKIYNIDFEDSVLTFSIVLFSFVVLVFLLACIYPSVCPVSACPSNNFIMGRQN